MKARSRSGVGLLLDLALVGALAMPAACVYLRWPVLGIYAIVSCVLWRSVIAQPWVLRIMRDRGTRIAHGLEHATLAVLEQRGLPMEHGFTHAPNGFVVACAAGHGDAELVRDGAAEAIRRIVEGEVALAYHRGCGTSEVASALTLWLVFVITAVTTVAIGSSAALFVTLGIVVLRLWLACKEALGLIAQRLFTVSTRFVAARVVAVQAVRQCRGHRCPEDEAWFEVLVDVTVPAAEGGLVSPSLRS